MKAKRPPKLNAELKERIEHRDVLLAINELLITKSGRFFFGYIFKHFDVLQMPEIGLEGQILFERLGNLRAGRAIFDLVAEANPKVAGELIAQTEKERHASIYGEDFAERSE